MTLWEAVQNNDTDQIHTLVKQEFDIHVKDNKGQTLFMLAVSDNCPDAARALIELGVDVNAVDNMGRNALFYVKTAVQAKELIDAEQR